VGLYNGHNRCALLSTLLDLWFLLNKTVFGLNPHWFHVTTVLAHVAATALAFFIARVLLKNFGAAVLAAAIFGLHPLQAESASWISSVNDSLAAVFCFASFLTCKKARVAQQRAGLWWAISGFTFLLALLVKEVSAVLPAIVLVDWWSESKSASEAWKTQLSLTLVLGTYGFPAIIWAILRHHALGQVAAGHSYAGWIATFVTAPKIVLFDLYRVIVPAGLSPHYDFKAADTAARSLAALFVVIALVLGAILAARKSRPHWVAYVWFLLPLLPSLNLRWLNEDDFVHDRYMSMSMLGTALLVGAAYTGLRTCWPDTRLTPILSVGLIIALAFASAIQSQFWANDVHLFSRAVQVAPNNEWAQLNYGAALSARGKYAEAVPYFARSYDLKANWRAADYAGFAYQKSGNLPQAEHWFSLALHMHPSLADAWFGLGQIHLQEHRPAEAVAFLQKAVEFQPDAEGYHYALGSALEQLGQKDAALEAYRTELRLHPYQTGAREAIERLTSAQ
jgi:Tfp pilus assembly protein PilF